MLLLLEFNLSVSTNLDYTNAAGKLRQTLLQFLAIPVAVGTVNLALDLRDTVLHNGSVASAIHDGGVVLGDDNAASATEYFKTNLVNLETNLCSNNLAAGEDCDVFQDCLATVTEGRCLHGSRCEGATDAVDHERRQCLAINIFRDDEQRLARLCHFLQQRQDVLHTGNLVRCQKDVGILKNRFHPLGVSDEVGRDVALVELHTFGEVQLKSSSAGLFHADDAVLADLVKRIGEQLANLPVLGRDGGDIGNLSLVCHWSGIVEQTLSECRNCSINATLEVHGSPTRSDDA